jgi:hypothetical protein
VPAITSCFPLGVTCETCYASPGSMGEDLARTIVVYPDE